MQTSSAVKSILWSTTAPPALAWDDQRPQRCSNCPLVFSVSHGVTPAPPGATPHRLVSRCPVRAVRRGASRPVSVSARDVAQPSPTEQLSCLRTVAHVLRRNAQSAVVCLAWEQHHQLWLWRNSSRPFRLLSLSPLVLCRAQPTEDGLSGMDDMTQQPAWVETVRRMVTERGAHP